MEVTPAVAAPTSLSFLPRAALPSCTGAGREGGRARFGAGGRRAQEPQAKQAAGAHGRAGLRGAGRAAERAWAAALPPPKPSA